MSKTIKSKILVTGGAGFIGSNIVASLLKDERVSKVRVLDNLSTGFEHNLDEFQKCEKFEFIKGDIRNFDTCSKACFNMTKICHQAALGSVPRSVKDPITSNDVNVGGTINIFKAAINHNIDRVVFASSSSVYGDDPEIPKQEDRLGNPMSPYALTKLITEQYAKVFSNVYSFKYVGLRYFNIFGPKQSPKGAYAAVIPIFIQNALRGKSSTINGKHEISRDFTYVENAVQANLRALFSDNKYALNRFYNIAIGQQITLNHLHQLINKKTHRNLPVTIGETRAGDVPRSLADISNARNLLGYDPTIGFEEGIEKTISWFNSQKL